MRKRKEKSEVKKQRGYPGKPVTPGVVFFFYFLSLVASLLFVLSPTCTHIPCWSLQLQVDRISIGVFQNFLVHGGVIMRQGMLSSSAIFAKSLPKKISKQGPIQPSLPYSSDCRVESISLCSFSKPFLARSPEDFP